MSPPNSDTLPTLLFEDRSHRTGVLNRLSGPIPVSLPTSAMHTLKRSLPAYVAAEATEPGFQVPDNQAVFTESRGKSLHELATGTLEAQAL